MVVPEERHLLLQRTPRVDHPEQPALARVVDVDIGREEIFRGHLRVVGPADARVDVVGTSLVVDEVSDRGIERHPGKGVGLRGAGAEACPSEQMLEVGIQL